MPDCLTVHETAAVLRRPERGIYGMLGSVLGTGPGNSRRHVARQQRKHAGPALAILKKDDDA